MQTSERNSAPGPLALGQHPRRRGRRRSRSPTRTAAPAAAARAPPAPRRADACRRSGCRGSCAAARRSSACRRSPRRRGGRRRRRPRGRRRRWSARSRSHRTDGPSPAAAVRTTRTTSWPSSRSDRTSALPISPDDPVTATRTGEASVSRAVARRGSSRDRSARWRPAGSRSSRCAPPRSRGCARGAPDWRDRRSRCTSAIPTTSRSRASSSVARSVANCSGTVSPTSTLPRRWRFGVPSRNRIRSTSDSAWRISSIDSSRTALAMRRKPQFSHILAWTKYWLTAVSSPVSTSFRSSMTRGLPCMEANLVPYCSTTAPVVRSATSVPRSNRTRRCVGVDRLHARHRVAEAAHRPAPLEPLVQDRVDTSWAPVVDVQKTAPPSNQLTSPASVRVRELVGERKPERAALAAERPPVLADDAPDAEGGASVPVGEHARGPRLPAGEGLLEPAGHRAAPRRRGSRRDGRGRPGCTRRASTAPRTSHAPVGPVQKMAPPSNHDSRPRPSGHPNSSESG